MAFGLEMSKSSVQRVWPNDSHVEEKGADIIALYKKPCQRAAVLCVDEKRAIQAVDRLELVLPLSSGCAMERCRFMEL